MAQEMLLYPICTGHFFYESGYSLSRDAYDSYLILYIESGSMTVAIRGNKLSAMAEILFSSIVISLTPTARTQGANVIGVILTG